MHFNCSYDNIIFERGVTMKESIIVLHLRKTFILSKKQMRIEHAKENKRVAVNDISFTTYQGEIFGLLGPNGAGKTTTLRCISTLIKPDSGTITVNGFDVKDDIKVKKSICFLTNELKLEEQMTPTYAFNYYARFYDLPDEVIKERREKLFKIFGIEKFAEVKISDLSTGMKQKTSIVVSLVNDPDIIIFDEPTNGLDVLTAKLVTDYLLELKKAGKSIIISTHIMNLVEKICDRVGIIINGKMIVCDTVENICNLSPNHDLEEVFFKLYQEEMKEE